MKRRPGALPILFARCSYFLLESGLTKTLGVIMPSLEIQLQTSTAMVGLITTLFSAAVYIGSLLTKFWISRVSKPSNRRLVTTGCGLVAGCALIGTSFMGGVPVMAVLFFITGLCCSMCQVQTIKLMFDYFQEDFPFASALSLLGIVLAGVVFPPIAQMIASEYGVGGSLLLFGGVFLNLVPIGLALKEREHFKGKRLRRRKEHAKDDKLASSKLMEVESKGDKENITTNSNNSARITNNDDPDEGPDGAFGDDEATFSLPQHVDVSTSHSRDENADSTSDQPSNVDPLLPKDVVETGADLSPSPSYEIPCKSLAWNQLAEVNVNGSCAVELDGGNVTYVSLQQGNATSIHSLNGDPLHDPSVTRNNMGHQDSLSKYQKLPSHANLNCDSFSKYPSAADLEMPAISVESNSGKPIITTCLSWLNLDVLIKEPMFSILVFPSIVLLFITYGGWMFFVVMYGVEEGLDLSLAAYFQTSGSIGGLVAAVPTSIALKHRARWAPEIYAQFLMLCSVYFCVQTVSSSYIFLLVMSFLMGFAFFGANLIVETVMVLTVAPENFSNASSLFLVAIGLGFLTTGYITGSVRDLTGDMKMVFRFLGGVSALNVIIVLLISYFLRKRRTRETNQERE